VNLAAIRAGIAAVNYGDMDALPYIPDTITPITIAVGRMQMNYNQTMSGLVEVAVTLHAFSSRADTWQGQDDLMAPGGLKASLETDRTLGGVCSELRVETCDGPGIADVGGQQYWAANWTVRVWGQ